MSLLLTLNNFTPCSRVSIVNFEHVITGWVLRKSWLLCFHYKFCDFCDFCGIWVFGQAYRFTNLFLNIEIFNVVFQNFMNIFYQELLLHHISWLFWITWNLSKNFKMVFLYSRIYSNYLYQRLLFNFCIYFSCIFLCYPQLKVNSKIMISLLISAQARNQEIFRAGDFSWN